MTRKELMERLAALFEKTAEAHHAAFAASDGEDPEWPLWYATALREEIGPLLDCDFTNSELVWALVSAHKELEQEGDDEWAHFYADFFQDTYAS